MRIVLKDGSVHAFPLGEITKLTFGTIVGTGDVRQLENVIKTFALFQNYPNPFNPTTTIIYTLPLPGTVDIAVFNIAGQMIRHFSPSYESPGEHTLTWNGQDESGASVASGVYFYRVKFGSSVLSRKMMVIK